MGRLTASKISKLKKPGMYPDGCGLYVQVGPNGARSWVFRYALRGKTHYMGLGSLAAVSEDAARTRAAECRRQKSSGLDPLESRKQIQFQLLVAEGRKVTFQECADAYIEAHKGEWRNSKHLAQWISTLKTYARPVIGNLPVQAVDTTLVLKVLEPIWKIKTETASRLRGRIEAILDWAKTRGYREGENPAGWRGHLQMQFAKRPKSKHFPALPFSEVAAFLLELRKIEGTSARALELLILTAARTSEVLGARWEEMDLGQAVWTIPADRMKAEREHRVPLSKPALKLLEKMSKERVGEFVFPGRKLNKPLSNMALLMVLRRMGRGDIKVHGFRSTFRDWVGEATHFPREVAVAALAHVNGDKTDEAYQRGAYFEKRRLLMADWARFCGRVPGSANVVPFQQLVAR